MGWRKVPRCATRDTPLSVKCWEDWLKGGTHYGKIGRKILHKAWSFDLCIVCTQLSKSNSDFASKNFRRDKLVHEQNERFSFNVYCFRTRKIWNERVHMIRNHKQTKKNLCRTSIFVHYFLPRLQLTVKQQGKSDNNSPDFLIACTSLKAAVLKRKEGTRHRLAKG